jgi:hypothetical protein
MLFEPLLSLGRRKVRMLAAKPNVPDLEYLIALVADGPNSAGHRPALPAGADCRGGGVFQPEARPRQGDCRCGVSPYF